MTRHPEVPWRQIADIGNVLRHEYQLGAVLAAVRAELGP
jgi:uncharacterized protein with HEPN domain